MMVTPKRASVGDAFLFILPSGSRKIKNLINCPDEEVKFHTNFQARWAISVSILVPKLLVALAPVLKILGKLISLILGKLWTGPSQITPMELLIIRPENRYKEWEIIFPNDETMSLEESEFRYYSALTMMASKLAYHHHLYVKFIVTNCWKMKLTKCHIFWNAYLKAESTHAFMFENKSKDVTVVAFRGTSVFDLNDWIVDSNFLFKKLDGVGQIHSGFMQALGYQDQEIDHGETHGSFAYNTLALKLKTIAESNDNAKFIITGHSMGGALATLFVSLLAYNNETTILHKLQAVYTYGQPRVGDQNFAEFMVRTFKTYDIQYYRYVYSFDMIPRVPFDSMVTNYKHFGGCVYFDCFYRGKFLEQQPHTNYFSLIWLIPKYLIAYWELLRSLIIIPIMKGKDHFEGLFTIMERILGLLIPGLSAHVCSNYVNLTRWGIIHLLPDHNETLKKLAQHVEADYSI